MLRLFRLLDGEMGDHTWGARNTLSMQHPLSAVVPMLARWLDMPRQQLPGDSNMPRVQSPSWGHPNASPSHRAMKTTAIFTSPAARAVNPPHRSIEPVTAIGSRETPRRSCRYHRPTGSS
jgi:hypothetical protein